jgi:hypothetical protein
VGENAYIEKGTERALSSGNETQEIWACVEFVSSLCCLQMTLLLTDDHSWC